ncbi:alcohol dehydrogenase catalytic domain-containing protein [Streptomyces sp. NPDC097727]|uniref:alcohol dehydrogenase catalytic domain-containing protein n=1 Tax=Streptomyces sp. NPDC097727 TaxID=3366092 RepID=UPI0038108D8C
MLIRVKAAGVNPVDWKLAEGLLDAVMETHFPLVLGRDVADVVERVGFDVQVRARRRSLRLHPQGRRPVRRLRRTRLRTRAHAGSQGRRAYLGTGRRCAPRRPDGISGDRESVSAPVTPSWCTRPQAASGRSASRLPWSLAHA